MHGGVVRPILPADARDRGRVNIMNFILTPVCRMSLWAAYASVRRFPRMGHALFEVTLWSWRQCLGHISPEERQLIERAVRRAFAYEATR